MNLDRWVDVTDPEDLSAALGIDLPAHTGIIYAAIEELTGSGAYWMTGPGLMPPTPEHTLSLQIAQTRVFINLSQARQVRADIAILAIVYLATQNVGLTAILGVANKLRGTLRMLTADESELVSVIIGIAAPDNAYATAVPRSSVQAAYKDASIDVNRLLESLEAKNVLREEPSGKIRLTL